MATDEKPKKPPKATEEEQGDAKPTTPETKPISFLQLFRYATKFEIFLNVIGIIAAAAAGATQPLMTLLFGRLTQDFINFTQVIRLANAGSTEAQESIPAAAHAFRVAAAKNASYLVYIGVGLLVTTYIYMTVWVYTGEVNAKRIREKYLRAVLRQDIAWFDSVGAGEVATRIQTDTHLVQQGISEKVPISASFLGAFFTGYILAYIRSWRLALAMTSILPGIIIIGGVMNKVSVGFKQGSLKHIAEGGTLAEEVISTVRTAQAFGTQRTLAGNFEGHINQSRDLEIKAAIWRGGATGAFFFILYGAYGLAFSFGTTLINEGHGNAGQILNVFMSIFIGSLSLSLLAPEVTTILNGRSAAAKLYETIDRVPDIDSANPGGLKPDATQGEITLENVRFSYPSRPTIEVTKGISITFHAGKTAALVGASGSGKSTVVSLVERFYDPTSGVVKLDGRDIKTLNLKWLRSQIGYVAQEPTLFGVSVRANVEYGLLGTKYEHVSEEEKATLVREACVKANAHGFITQLPNGYDTLVGERGLLLSGGQKQRIAIARAIVSDPRILLLDEATSALDTQSEGIVQEALDKAAQGRTTITIAHRLSTIKDADVIYVMGDGLVLEQGTHGELISKGGAYYQLVEAQKLREKAETDAQPADDGETDVSLSKEEEKIPLQRRQTDHSLSSAIAEKGATTQGKDEPGYSMLYLIRRMVLLARDNWHQYSIAAIFAIMVGMVYPAFGVVYATGINGFSLTTSHERRVAGDRTALWLFLIAIISSVCITFQTGLFGSAGTRMTSKLRVLSFQAMLRQDIVFFDRDENSTGALVSQLSDNPQKVDGLAGITLGALFQTAATIISGAVLGLAFVWRVGLVGIALMPALLSVGYTRLRVVVLKDQANKKAHEDSAHLACEAAASIRTVAALTREDDCLRIYSESLEEPLQRSNRTALWSNLLYAFTQGITQFSIALVFWYGSLLVSRQQATLFQFFIGLMSTTFSAIQAGNVFMYVPDISLARGAAADIIKLLDSMPEIDAESIEGKVIEDKRIEGHIRLDNVHFRYPTRRGVRVLRGLTLDVKPGTYVALVGGSGSGKSTVIQLIERFYDPIMGEVTIDGENIAELNVQEYRKHIALVSQEPTLYSGTIRFNILLGAPGDHSDITQEDIEDACRDANVLDFIQGLPQGFDTEVGGKGSQLSGGQKQRIAIARALLRKPKVLLLDEATSALDSTSEKVVQAALDQAAKGRTTIAIAHRLSTIQNADKIYFIKDGVVSESGTHDQLLERRGDYYEFVRLQALSGK
ncbi:P-loop containing nucleoside triphosphate hydrolase protein [Agrocybe pediades]|nr:P-loop containing nucleoside triphosphate hydrolase protein [Agrocybe pediades]